MCVRGCGVVLVGGKFLRGWGCLLLTDLTIVAEGSLGSSDIT